MSLHKPARICRAVVLLTALLVFSGSLESQAALVTLIDENFATGTTSNPSWISGTDGKTWTWSPQNGETGSITSEVWTGTAGASARGLSQTYDHDQNGGTAAVSIPGGFEVMSGFTSNGLPDTMRATVSFNLPALLDDSINGSLTFFAANRLSGGSGGQGASVSIFNVTDNTFILPVTSITFPGGSTNWNFKNLAVDFAATDAGDLIELRFQDSITSGSGSGARGLQIADVGLTAEVIPEPTTCVSVLLLTLLALRCRKKCPVI